MPNGFGNVVDVVDAVVVEECRKEFGAALLEVVVEVCRKEFGKTKQSNRLSLKTRLGRREQCWFEHY